MEWNRWCDVTSEMYRETRASEHPVRPPSVHANQAMRPTISDGRSQKDVETQSISSAILPLGDFE